MVDTSNNLISTYSSRDMSALQTRISNFAKEHDNEIVLDECNIDRDNREFIFNNQRKVCIYCNNSFTDYRVNENDNYYYCPNCDKRLPEIGAMIPYPEAMLNLLYHYYFHLNQHIDYIPFEKKLFNIPIPLHLVDNNTYVKTELEKYIYDLDDTTPVYNIVLMMCNGNLIVNGDIFYTTNEYNYWEECKMPSILTKIRNLLKGVKNHYIKNSKFVSQLSKCYKQLTNVETIASIKEELDLINKDNISFNTNKSSVPFINGVYNLETKEFVNSSPELYINKWLNVEYVPTVPTTKANDYLKQLKIDKKDIFIKHLSYSLKHKNEGMMLILGSGGNGKTSFIGFLKELFGDNHIKLRNDFFTKQKTDDTMTDRNKMIYTLEIKFDNKIDAGILNDRIYGTEELNLNGIVIATTNHKPDINSTNDMINRRIFTYTFGNKFKKNNKDTLDREEIKDKFKTDVELKQSFINLLLEYNYKDILVEEEQYNDNNQLQDFILDYIERKCDNVDIIKFSYNQLKNDYIMINNPRRVTAEDIGRKNTNKQLLRQKHVTETFERHEREAMKENILEETFDKMYKSKLDGIRPSLTGLFGEENIEYKRLSINNVLDRYWIIKK
jgi:hypothetical protein